MQVCFVVKLNLFNNIFFFKEKVSIQHSSSLSILIRMIILFWDSLSKDLKEILRN